MSNAEDDRIEELERDLNLAMAALTEIKKSKNWLAAWTIADQAIKKVEEAK